MEEYISRQQAQRMLGCDKDSIIKLLLSGEIKSSRKENGGWLVSRVSVEKYLAKKAEKDVHIADLQRIIAEYKQENKLLRKLLKDNGINYESEIVEKVPRVKSKKTIADLELSKRALHALYLCGNPSINQLRDMSLEDLLKIDGIGKKTALEIKTQLLKNCLEPK
jgi:DNA-directed RNA polymerase alpha subunit